MSHRSQFVFVARLCFLALCPAIVLPLPTAHAKVAKISLEKMTARSDLVVVAEVLSVRKGAGDEKVARAAVIETWKGTPVKEVEFHASPSWQCDVADAVEGETVVLFLTRKDKESPIYRISHSGRGRMPLRTLEKGRYATIRVTDLKLPRELATVPVPEAEPEFIRSAAMDDLKSFVRRQK